MKKMLFEILKIFVISLVITIVWQLLELITTGEISPNNVDSIIALALTFSIYFNSILYKKTKTAKDVIKK